MKKTTPNNSSWTWQENGATVVRSIGRSGPGCHQGCGVLLHVRDGRLVKVEGDPCFPLNQGRLCPRCLSLPQTIYHNDRLRYPLKRAGRKGEDKWERITWQEALDSIAAKFNKIKQESGPESVVFCSGTGRDIRPYTLPLAQSFGSPNYVSFGPLHGSACFMPKILLMNAISGTYVVADCAQSFADRYDNADWKVPECIVIWGNDPLPSSSDGFMGHWIIECMKRDSELIVIDPRQTWIASRAKFWLQIRPGTDAALALGMLNVIINEKLYDEDFVRKWTYGFEELKRRVQEYPPDKVAQITWIPEKLIIEAARMYAGSKPAAIQWGVALDQSKECTATLHAIIGLWSITGNFDVPGGNIVGSQLFGLARLLPQWTGLLKPEQMARKIGGGKYPLLEWAGQFPREQLIDQINSGRPYPIRAAWFQGTNTFACGTADSRGTYDAFKKIDFVVVADLFMTPTAMALADIVLPVSTYAERDGLAIPIGFTTCVATINKAIEPVGECKSDMEINLELGRRLNPSAWPWKDVREMFDDLLKPASLTFEELRERGYAFDAFEYNKHEKGLLRPDSKPGFNTATGKVELYSKVLEKCGLDPLPYFEEPPESPVSTPEIAREYPLVLTTGARTWSFFHSEQRQIPLMRRLNPDPFTEIHPDTALKLGIKEGDWIYVESKYGRCKQKARLTRGIHPGVVCSQHGWWYPERPGAEPELFGAWDSNINLLLPGGWTGKAGFGYPYKNQLCKVYKAGEG